MSYQLSASLSFRPHIFQKNNLLLVLRGRDGEDIETYFFPSGMALEVLLGGLSAGQHLFAGNAFGREAVLLEGFGCYCNDVKLVEKRCDDVDFAIGGVPAESDEPEALIGQPFPYTRFPDRSDELVPWHTIGFR